MIEGRLLSFSYYSKLHAHHLSEIPNAALEGPKIMVICVGIGTFTGAIFLIVLLFVAGNIDEVISSAAGPLLQILIHATSNTAGAICLLMFVLSSSYHYQLTFRGGI